MKMLNRLSYYRLIRQLVRVLACSSLALPLVHAGEPETWTVEGVTYDRVRVHEVTPATVTIYHSGGISQLELADLPDGLQERFSYDPEAAGIWQQEVEQARNAAVAQRAKSIKKKKSRSKNAWLLRNNSNLYTPEQVVVKKSVDLRPKFREFGLYTKSQGRRPSCSVFAMVSALEYNLASRKGLTERLSEEYLIWATLQVRPGIDIDTGFNFTEVVNALHWYGVPPSKLMPNTFGKKMETIEPTKEAIEAAQKYRHVATIRFKPKDPQLLRRIIGALNEDNPVVIGVRWPHWRTLANNNLLFGQKPLEGVSHAVTLVGYRSPNGTPEKTTFIFWNSYGRSWGVGGCGFMASSYLKENVLSALYLDVP